MIDNAVDYERIKLYFLVPMTNGALMRKIFLGLAFCLAFAGLAKAEVVISNTVGSSSGVSVNQDVLKTFTTTASAYWSITNIRFGINIASGASTNFSAVKAYLYENPSGSGSIYNRIATYDFGAFNSSTTGNHFFDANPGAGWDNLSGSRNYFIGLETVGSISGGAVEWLSATGTDGGAWGSTGSYRDNGAPFAFNATFDTSTATTQFGTTLYLNVTAVPEPGTLLLGGIAACSGAAGAWWKRRKRKTTQPETADQPATA